MAITTARTTIRAGNINFRLAIKIVKNSAETSASLAGDRMYIKFQHRYIVPDARFGNREGSDADRGQSDRWNVKTVRASGSSSSSTTHEYSMH